MKISDPASRGNDRPDLTSSRRMRSAMADGMMQQIQGIVTTLRTELADLKGEIKAAAMLAAAAQMEVRQHAAVCAERDRQAEARQKERDRWHDGEAKKFEQFMVESTADRARIRESILTTAAIARDDLRLWMIRVLSCVAGFNVVGAAGIIFGMMKIWGH